MRRNATWVIAAAFAGVMCTGCGLFQKKEEPAYASTYDPAYDTTGSDPYATSSGSGTATTSGNAYAVGAYGGGYGDPYGGSTYGSSTTTYPSSSTGTMSSTAYNSSGSNYNSSSYGGSTSSPAASSSASRSGGQYHEVARRDTLYSLARSYYGDERRWRDIFDANRDTVSDPNKIFVGQRLLIP